MMGMKETEADEESAASEPRAATWKEPLEPPPGQILATTLTGPAPLLADRVAALGLAAMAAATASSIVPCLAGTSSSSSSGMTAPRRGAAEMRTRSGEFCVGLGLLAVTCLLNRAAEIDRSNGKEERASANGKEERASASRSHRHRVRGQPEPCRGRRSGGCCLGFAHNKAFLDHTS